MEWLYQNNNYSDFIKAWCVKITLTMKTLIAHLINWQEIKKKLQRKYIMNHIYLMCYFFYACKLCIACIIYKILFFVFFCSLSVHNLAQLCSPSVWLIDVILFINNVLSFFYYLYMIFSTKAHFIINFFLIQSYTVLWNFQLYIISKWSD